MVCGSVSLTVIGFVFLAVMVGGAVLASAIMESITKERKNDRNKRDD